MAKAKSGAGVISWDRFRGRNGVDDPSMLPPDMGTEAINWVINSQGIGERRRGTKNAALTGAFSGYASLARFTPGQDEEQAQIVFSTFDTPSKFMVVTPASAPAATELTQTDTLVGSPIHVSYAVGNGKLFMAYKNTGGNRLHIYDPAGGATIRRAGLAPPPAPDIVADIGSGSYPAVARYYRIQGRQVVSGVTKTVSSLGVASPIFMPSGTGAAVRVQHTGTPGENSWRLFGSLDGVLYYAISPWLADSVLYYDDAMLTTAYASQTAAPLEGSRYPLPSAKFLLWDGAHLLLFGTHGDQANNDLPAVPGRVYITAALDSTVEGGDDESIVMTQEVKGYVDLNRNGGAEDRAICGQVDGNVLVFQSRGVWLLKPTGNAARPYARIALSREIGAVNHWSTFVGEDEAGRPCVYWLDPDRGPYRYGYNGLEWIGYDVQDLFKTTNLAAASASTVACGLYDPSVRRCYWWISADGTNYPSMGLTFHVAEARLTQTQGARYGWTQFRGYAASCYCCEMLPQTLGNPMSRKLKPYTGDHQKLVQFDADGINTDYLLYNDVTPANEPYFAYVRSKAWVTSALPLIVALEKSWIRGPCSDAIVAQSLLRNFGDDEALLSTVPLHPEGAETRRVFLFEEALMAGAWTFQTQLGDAVRADQHYAIDRWDARMTATDLEVGTSAL